VAIASLVEELKTSSSVWMKSQSPELGEFSWQRGYASFSVNPNQLDDLRAYIDRQEEHHRTRTFQEEYRAFLTKYGVEFDERYVWD
jgi:putative transposase